MLPNQTQKFRTVIELFIRHKKEIVCRFTSFVKIPILSDLYFT